MDLKIEGRKKRERDREIESYAKDGISIHFQRIKGISLLRENTHLSFVQLCMKIS